MGLRLVRHRELGLLRGRRLLGQRLQVPRPRHVHVLALWGGNQPGLRLTARPLSEEAVLEVGTHVDMIDTRAAAGRLPARHAVLVGTPALLARVVDVAESAGFRAGRAAMSILEDVGALAVR